MSALDSDQLETLRTRFKAERPTYQALAEEVRARILTAARDRGLRCTCYARAKEIDSFVKKTLLKEYRDPYDQIRDKAGVRLIVAYLDDLPNAERLIRDSFVIEDYTDKNLGLAVDQLGYRGIHFEVTLKESTFHETGGEERNLRGLVCEVQVQTRAQNLWNDASHAFLYKPDQPAPEHVKRRIFRLVALMELFDDELVATRKAIADLPGSDTAAMFAQLESNFLRLTSKPFNRKLSFQVIDLLRSLLSQEDAEQFHRLLATFLKRKSDQLSEMYDDYFEIEDPNPLIFQPETILLLERLEHDRFALRDRWSEEYPMALLENLAGIWGIDV